jgi:hypothetical protein
VFAGVEIGYFPYRGVYRQANFMTPVNVSGFGIETGGHSGCNYHFSKTFDVNAQIGYINSSVKERTQRGIVYPSDRKQPDYTTVGNYGSFEFSLGIRYTIQFREPDSEDVPLPN